MIGGANTDRVAEGHGEGECAGGDVPPPARSAKLKLPPFYKVNGKLKRGPLQFAPVVLYQWSKKFSSSGPPAPHLNMALH